MIKSKYEQPIMSAARKQFAGCGYYGARIDTISEESRVNKRLVYEFCRTKDGLYMMVLSEVSREVMKAITEHGTWRGTDVRTIYGELFNILEKYDDCLRLWAWERMSPTIHGPRILETVNSIFELVRQEVLKSTPSGREISAEIFESIEALCHGYLLTAAMYLHCEPEIDEAESEQAANPVQFSSPAFRRLDISMNLQGIILESIEKLVLS